MREGHTDRRPPAWNERSVYDRMLTLDHAGWTWEALRRRLGDAGRILPVSESRLLRRSPPLRLIETPNDDGPEIWGWRFPRRAIRIAPKAMTINWPSVRFRTGVSAARSGADRSLDPARMRCR